MKPSIISLIKKHGWRIDRTIHNYIYFKWYYPYVKTVTVFLRILQHLTWLKPLKYVGKSIFNRYHSKVLSHRDIKRILILKENIQYVGQLNKQIIPYKYAYKIIFQDPEFIVVMDCPCKKSLHAPVETINSCIAVGSGIGKFWLDECKKYNPRKITQEEALEIVKNFRSKGYITQAFFKVATGGSTGVICNCHPKSCVSLLASRITRKIDKNLTMNAQSGYSVMYDGQKCTLCGKCVTMCHFNAIKITNEGRFYQIDECMGCELCVEVCPNNALSLYIDPQKPLPLNIDIIEKKR